MSFNTCFYIFFTKPEKNSKVQILGCLGFLEKPEKSRF